MASTAMPNGAFQLFLHFLRPCDLLLFFHFESLDFFSQDLLNELQRILHHVLTCKYDRGVSCRSIRAEDDEKIGEAELTNP